MIINIHERLLPMTIDQVGALLETLSSPDDQIWQTNACPPMKLNQGLNVGSRGGHGSVHYHVVAHTPKRSVQFEFEPGIGLEGHHGFEVIEAPVSENGSPNTLLRHTIKANLVGSGHIIWPLIVRAIHDAALEDMLDHVELMASGQANRAQKTPPLVRALARLTAKMGI